VFGVAEEQDAIMEARGMPDSSNLSLKACYCVGCKSLPPNTQMRLIIKYKVMKEKHDDIIITSYNDPVENVFIDGLFAGFFVGVFITLVFLMGFFLIKNAGAQAVQLTASVPKSDYYVCLEACQSACLEFIK